MTHETNQDFPEVDELTVLKQRATRMGINFSNNIGVDALRKKIEEATTEVVEPQPAISKAALHRKQVIKEGTKLIRCRIQNLDPKKASLPGEIITVANDYLGTVRRFIPYSAEAQANGWHIPQCILNAMRERTFVHISTKKDSKGTTRTVAKDVPEFNIAILAPLSKEELGKLADAQRAAGTIPVGSSEQEIDL